MLGFDLPLRPAHGAFALFGGIRAQGPPVKTHTTNNVKRKLSGGARSASTRYNSMMRANASTCNLKTVEVPTMRVLKVVKVGRLSTKAP